MAPCFDRVMTNLSTGTAHDAIEWGDYRGSKNSDRKAGDEREGKPPLHVISVEDDEYINLLMQKEDSSMSEIRGYANHFQGDSTEMRSRTPVINWIRKVHAYFGFRSQTAFLSVTYFDRFFFKHPNSRGKTWLQRLVAVGSISLAAKLQEIEVPLLLDLQVGDVDYVFEPRIIQRMELLIMSTLHWKMNNVTPYSYLQYLLRKVGGLSNGRMSEALKDRSEELILHSCRDIRYLSYSPSAVAVASLVLACREEVPSQAARLQQILLSIWPLKEIESVEWAHLMDQLLQQDLFLPSVETALLKSVVPLSPMGVLDAACFSSDSCDQTFNTFPTTGCASTSVNAIAPIIDSAGVSHKNGRIELNELTDPSSTSSLPPQISCKRNNLGDEQVHYVQNKHLWRTLHHTT